MGKRSSVQVCGEEEDDRVVFSVMEQLRYPGLLYGTGDRG